MIPILIGAVFAQMLASAYLLYQLNRIRTEVNRATSELTQTREQLRAELAEVRQMSTTASKQASQITAETIETLKAQVEAAKRQVGMTAGKSRIEAEKHLSEVTAKLTKVEDQVKENRQETAVAKEVASQAKSGVDAAENNVGKLSNKVEGVQSGLDITKKAVEKQADALQDVKVELSNQIARNNSELAALKARGDRDYVEFTVNKDGSFHRCGLALVKLRSTDIKKNRYTIEVMFNDKPLERKDIPINQLQQFSLGRDQFLHLVVNDVQKNAIVGYVSTPKADKPR